MRNSSLFQTVNLSTENIYQEYYKSKCFLGSCEIMWNIGAQGVNREWEEDALQNINEY